MKVLFFTQYRITQQFLCERLRQLFVDCGVEVIHGELGLEQRREARARFEKSSRFMVLRKRAVKASICNGLAT